MKGKKYEMEGRIFVNAFAFPLKNVCVHRETLLLLTKGSKGFARERKGFAYECKVSQGNAKLL